MANKRMFNKAITNSDPFLDMPLSAQCLYFHLGMNGDDDGFVASKSILRLIQAKDDDLKILIIKGFVIPFNDSVIVITHRKTNNLIRSDRYTPTIYKEHLKNLILNDGAYQWYTKCHTNGIPNIDKDNIIKDNKSIDKSIDTKSEDFETIPESTEFGKKEINLLIKELKELSDKLGVSYDKYNERNFGKFIISAKEYGDFCEKIGQTRIEFAKNIMIASIKINFFKGPCTGPMKIYQNYSEVYNQTQLKNKKIKEQSRIAFIPGIGE